jgi:hypothetical protein
MSRNKCFFLSSNITCFFKFYVICDLFIDVHMKRNLMNRIKFDNTLTSFIVCVSF